MHVWNMLHAARWKYRTQKWRKKSPSAHHRITLSGMELWNFHRVRQLYSAGRPSRWASAHIIEQLSLHPKDEVYAFYIARFMYLYILHYTGNVACVSLSVFGRQLSKNDLWRRYLARWFLAVTRSNSWVKVISQSSRLQKENVNFIRVKVKLWESSSVSTVEKQTLIGMLK